MSSVKNNPRTPGNTRSRPNNMQVRKRGRTLEEFKREQAAELDRLRKLAGG